MTQNRESTRYFSNIQEQKVADILGMRQQVNSGATTFDKGDVLDEHMVLDAKTVMKPQSSVSLKEDWFDKSREEAFGMGRGLSGIAFRFAPKGRDYVAMPIDDFRQLYEAWKELNG